MIELIIGSLIGTILGAVGVFVVLQRTVKSAQEVNTHLQEKSKKLEQEIEVERRESALKLKNEVLKKRKEFDIELKNERVTLDRLHSKLNEKRERIEEREGQLDTIKRELEQKERELSRKEDTLRSDEQKLKKLYEELLARLEHISGMSRDDAKRTIIEMLEADVRHAHQKWIQKVEDETRQTAKEHAIDIVATAMQRYTADQVTPHSSGVVHLPNDEMKGRQHKIA
jgi:ribonucrease Y